MCKPARLKLRASGIVRLIERAGRDLETWDLGIIPRRKLLQLTNLFVRLTTSEKWTFGFRPTSPPMLAHVCHALHVPNRFNRGNLEEIKGYGVLALKSYVLSQKDRRRRAQLLFTWAFGGKRRLLDH